MCVCFGSTPMTFRCVRVRRFGALVLRRLSQHVLILIYFVPLPLLLSAAYLSLNSRRPPRFIFLFPTLFAAPEVCHVPSSAPYPWGVLSVTWTRDPMTGVTEVCHFRIRMALCIQRVSPPGSHYRSRLPCQMDM